MTAHVQAHSIEQFQQQGATVLRGVFADWVEVLREGIAANMADPNPNARIYHDENGGGRFFVDYCSWQRIPDYREFIFNSPVAEIASELMESNSVQLFHEHVLVKEAQTGVPTPWHQDMPYYCVDGQKTLSLWIPLDTVPRERTLEFIAGSHRWGKFYRPRRFDGSPLNEGDDLEQLPDIDASRDEYNIVGWAVEPGDAVVFDFRTVHGAPGNNSCDDQRRAFSLRLVGENTRFVRRPGRVTSPPFEDITLQHGEPLTGSAFPVLFTRPD